MNWEEYKSKFQDQAIIVGLPLGDVEECLSYAFGLYERGLPVIYDQAHLSYLVGYDVKFILKASNSNGPFYRTYEIPKRNGGLRIIDEPLPTLKSIQRWILDEILSQVEISEHAHAFAKNCSIVKNARPHLASKKILSLDIENFFGTIDFPRVYSLFTRLGYNSVVATTLSHLVTIRGVLPQGAPTSPAISNIVTLKMDRRFSGYAKKLKLEYTRYADDITFSGEFTSGTVISFARRVVEEEGFKLNEAKTRSMGRHQAQEITGIITNVKLQVPRQTRRKLRQIAYHISTYGLDDHLRMTGELRVNYISHILGLASHVLHANPQDKDAMFLKSVVCVNQTDSF
ncbi:MAG: RNA-directed DNA polymerase [Geobacteraceae bacterium]|nr:RNA-directed DNA polymerase [Geobacteraceae bacterium]